MQEIIRPLPTKPLIASIFQNRGSQLERVAWSLDEVSLSNVYKFLDFNEALMLAHNSWTTRKDNLPNFRSYMSEFGSAPAHLIKELIRMKEGINLYHVRGLSDKNKELFERLNPNRGKELLERLSEIPAQDSAAFLDKIWGETNEHIFEIRYDEAKRRHEGDSSRVKIMSYQAKYPNGRAPINDAYAGHVSQAFRSYTPDVVIAPVTEKISRDVLELPLVA